MLTKITPLILTFNEAPNIRRTLSPLTWAREILVVDSFSTDETLDVLKSFPQVRVVQRKFDTHTQQWNFGLEHSNTLWVLALDADYVVPADFAQELENWQPGETVSAAFARFRYCIFGQSLRGTLYPPRAVLFRKDRCYYVQDGHTQQLQINGRTTYLNGVIEHDDRKPLSDWLVAQDRYASLEVEKLLSKPIAQLRFQDRLRRRIIIAPGLVFLYTLFFKGLILDGWTGWFYVLQRTYAELLLSLRLLECKLGAASKERGANGKGQEREEQR